MKDLQEHLQDTDPKLLIGWDSKDLCKNRQAVLIMAIRGVRGDLHEMGVPSKMRHHAGMYVVVFEPDQSNILLVMKTVLAVSRIKEVISSAKESTLRDRQKAAPYRGPIVVEQLFDELQGDLRTWN